MTVQIAQDINLATKGIAVTPLNRGIKAIFTDPMPNFILRKRFDQNQAATMNVDSCTVAKSRMVNFELC